MAEDHPHVWLLWEMTMDNRGGWAHTLRGVYATSMAAEDAAHTQVPRSRVQIERWDIQ